MWLLDVNLPKKVGGLLGEFGIEAVLWPPKNAPKNAPTNRGIAG